jgi:hypothetical protein
MYNYTRNESRRCKTTLETSEEDVKLHSKTKQSYQSREIFFFRSMLDNQISKNNQLIVGAPLTLGETVELCKVIYSRIGLLRSYGNLQSYWTTSKLWKLPVVLNYYEAMETYSRIELLRSYENLKSY